MRKGPAPKPPIDRLFARTIESDDGCWIVTSGLARNGYAQLYLPKPVDRPVIAHRYAYEYFIATIPDGLEIDHLCNQRACVNPWHMEPVRHADNIRRGSDRLWHNRTTCYRGHILTDDDLITYDGEQPQWIQRSCRQCRTETDRNRNRKLQPA